MRSAPGTTRARGAARAIAFAILCLIAASCADEGSNLSAGAGDEETDTSTTRPPRSTTEAPDTSEAPTTTNAAPDTSAGSIGTVFADPQGTYTIEIDPGWTEQSGTFVKEIEAWIVATPRDGFAPNVNVLTQDTGGMDLEEYLDFSVESMGTLELTSSDIVRAPNGNELAIIEYEGEIAGTAAGLLKFMATVDVNDGQAVVATLTADESTFDDLRVQVEPYLLTLQAT
jgi:hypothetical protein